MLNFVILNIKEPIILRKLFAKTGDKFLIEQPLE